MLIPQCILLCRHRAGLAVHIEPSSETEGRLCRQSTQLQVLRSQPLDGLNDRQPSVRYTTAMLQGGGRESGPVALIALSDARECRRRAPGMPSSPHGCVHARVTCAPECRAPRVAASSKSRRSEPTVEVLKCAHALAERPQSGAEIHASLRSSGCTSSVWQNSVTAAAGSPVLPSSVPKALCIATSLPSEATARRNSSKAPRWS